MAMYDGRDARRTVTQLRSALGFVCTCPECEHSVTDGKI